MPLDEWIKTFQALSDLHCENKNVKMWKKLLFQSETWMIVIHTVNLSTYMAHNKQNLAWPTNRS